MREVPIAALTDGMQTMWKRLASRHDQVRPSLLASGRQQRPRFQETASETHESDATDWQFAKWLIPSVTILFLVVGYVAVHGHESLLGWEQGLRDPNEYVATAADFIGSALANLLDVPVYAPGLVDPARLLVLCGSATLLSAGACLTAVGNWVPGRIRSAVAEKGWWRTTRRHPELGLTCALLLMVILKTSLLDVPLAKVDGVLVSQIDAAPPPPSTTAASAQATAIKSSGLLERLATKSASESVVSFGAKRSLALYSSIACSRRYDEDTKAVPGLNCPERRAKAFSDEQAEFTTQLASGGVVLGLALLLIQRTKSRLRAGFAWLCVASTLSVAYAYGKLEMSTEREFALIALKTRLDQTGDDKSGDMKQIVGVALTRDKDTTTIATLQKVSCGGTGAQLVRFWRIANSEVVWAREIFRTDVIAWKLSQEVNGCIGQTPGNNKGST